MKMGEEHDVPISTGMAAVLDRMRPPRRAAYVRLSARHASKPAR